MHLSVSSLIQMLKFFKTDLNTEYLRSDKNKCSTLFVVICHTGNFFQHLNIILAKKKR